MTGPYPGLTLFFGVHHGTLHPLWHIRWGDTSFDINAFTVHSKQLERAILFFISMILQLIPSNGLFNIGPRRNDYKLVIRPSESNGQYSQHGRSISKLVRRYFENMGNFSFLIEIHNFNILFTYYAHIFRWIGFFFYVRLDINYCSLGSANF